MGGPKKSGQDFSNTTLQNQRQSVNSKPKLFAGFILFISGILAQESGRSSGRFSCQLSQEKTKCFGFQLLIRTYQKLKKVLALKLDVCQTMPTMKTTQFVAYFRVSTARQGQSGLGLESQRSSAVDYVQKNGGNIVAEFTEIESGKKSDRAKFLEAISLCQKHGYTLLVAKLDRLARNVFVISSLMQSKINFLALDQPFATPFQIHILAAVAEFELTQVKTRTIAALQACKARGVSLGNPRYAESVGRAREAKSAKASERNAKLRTIIEEIKTKTGLSKLAELAEALNLRGIKTARGNAWTASHVFNLLQSA